MAGREGDKASIPVGVLGRMPEDWATCRQRPAVGDACSATLLRLFLSPPNNPPRCPHGPVIVCSLERLLPGC